MRGPDDLQRISLLLVLGGITTIYAASAVFTPGTTSIAALGEDNIGEVVRVNGTVKDLHTSEDAVFFTLEGESASIRAVHFGDGLGLSEGRAYTIEGRVDVYRGDLELVAESVVSGGSTPPHPG